MKKMLLAAGFAVSASTALAGGLNDPVVTPPPSMPADVIAADAASSGNMDFLIPLFFVLMWVTIGRVPG